ncbi:MAG: hypothetical protein QNI84_08210 [Henriciella sp.]|nr:hypothetical protein [Henriciella sp.]
MTTRLILVPHPAIDQQVQKANHAHLYRELLSKTQGVGEFQPGALSLRPTRRTLADAEIRYKVLT